MEADRLGRGRAREVDPPVAGSRSERSAPGALVRWVLRCTVLAGLLVGGWLIGGSTALAGPLDLEIPLGTESAPPRVPGLDTADPLGAVGTADGEGPALLDTVSGSTGVPEGPLPVVAELPVVAGLPEIVEPIVGVTRPLLPSARSDKAPPEVVDPPLAKNEPEPVSDPVSVPALLPAAVPAAVPAPVVSGPVAIASGSTGSAAEPAAAAHPDNVLGAPETSDPDGNRSALPCSTGASTGSGAASGSAVIGESLADPAPAASGPGVADMSTTRPRGLPPRPATVPD